MDALKDPDRLGAIADFLSMTPEVVRNASRNLAKWLLDHIRVYTSDKPQGPVLTDFEWKKYLVIEINLFVRVAFSIDLRENGKR